MPETSNQSMQPESQFEAVVAEYLRRKEEGRAPDTDQLLRDFPDQAERLREFFSGQALFDRLAPDLAPTPARRSESGTSAAGPAPGDRLGDFEILQELGRGGMGFVYRARQQTPEREVALKVLRGDRLQELGPAERTQWLERFRREAQLVADMDRHPHLVTLFEVGTQDEQPFFTMELVRGGNLAERLRPRPEPGPSLDLREKVVLLTKVARAIDHAHRRGVLHRDLKPGNILLDETGEPRVSDFGLAVRLDRKTASQAPSSVAGTLMYMAPEQAQASRGAITTAADVYSLGAILYELLTGRPPFVGHNDLETFLLILEREAEPPSRYAPGVSRDLETVCLKCLRKEPRGRYESAAALADDLDNWLAGRPVTARPLGYAARLRLWCRRNPVPATAAGVVLLTVGVAFSLITDSRDRALALAGRNELLAEEKGREATRANEEAERAVGEEKKAQREAMLSLLRQAQTLCEQGELGQALHVLARGLTLAERAEATDLERVFRRNLTAWGAHVHSVLRVEPHPAGVAAVACSPDGRFVATACWDRTTRVYDAATGKLRGEPVKHAQWVTRLVFSPDSSRLACVETNTVRLQEVDSGRPVGELSHPNDVTSAAFSPDGQLVLTRSLDGKARLWDLREGKAAGEALAHQGVIEAVAYDPFSRFVVTAGRNGRILLWDLATRRPLASYEHPGDVLSVALSPDGRTLLTGGSDGTARLWDLTVGQVRGLPLPHRGPVQAVALSPDGTLALTGSLDRTARVWDMATGKALGQPLTHPGDVLAVAFAANGRTVWTGQGRKDGDARCWAVALGDPIGAEMSHRQSILAIAVSPDGKRVATAGRDGTAQLWDGATGEPIGEPLVHMSEVNTVAFTPDSQLLLTGADNSTVYFWQATDGLPVLAPVPAPRGQEVKRPVLVSLSRFVGGPPVGNSLPKEKETYWGPGRGKAHGRRANENAAVFTVAVSPDGNKFVAAGRDGSAILSDVRYAGRWFQHAMRLEVRNPQAGLLGRTATEPDLFAAAFSPDGRLVAVGGEDGTVRLWDATKYDFDAARERAKGAKPIDQARIFEEALTPRQAGDPLKQEGPVIALAFSPDGRLLLAGSADGAARLWDVATGKLHVSPLRHSGPVVAVAFSPDGSRVATAGWDGVARIWQVGTGAAAGPPLAHSGKVLSVAFSPDGQTVLTAGEDATARIWDAGTGFPVGPPLRHRGQVRVAAFRPDGRAVVTAGDGGAAHLWPIPAAAEGLADVVRTRVVTQTATQQQLDGSVQLLDPVAWSASKAQSPPTAVSVEGWHRREARSAETAGRFGAARWHLDRLLATDPESGPLYLRRGKVALAQGDRAAALQDLDRAVTLLPAAWEPWFERGVLAVRDSRFQDGIDDLDKALKLRQAAEAVRGGEGRRLLGTILHQRAGARAALGQWKEAEADFARFMGDPFEEISLEARADFALLLHNTGDRRRYGVACQEMLAQFANPRNEPSLTVVTGEYGRREFYSFGKALDPEQAALMAWVSCLSPGALPDYARPVLIARRAASQDRQSYPVARALGVALYRAKEYEAAIQQLETAQSLKKTPSPSIWLLLALAQQQSGHSEQARKQLTRAQSWIENARKPGPDGMSAFWDRLPWTERVALEQLLREAEEAVNVKDPDNQ